MAPIGLRSSLNPSAKEFVPSQSLHGLFMAPSEAESQFPFPILDLPPEIVVCIITRLASKDAWHCVLVNKQLRTAVSAARVSFAPTDVQKHTLSNPAHSHLLDQVVDAVARYMPGALSCSLSMLPLEDSHISTLASSLAQLQVLDLAGCKKLKPAVTKVVMQQDILQYLQCLNLQRCFQLTDGCLSDVLKQSSCSDTLSLGSTSNKALQCIALSHLNLAGWPAGAGASCEPAVGTISVPAVTSGIKNQLADVIPHNVDDGHSCQSWIQLQQAVHHLLQCLPKGPELHGLIVPMTANGSSLRVVALNNCSQLSIQGLMTLTLSCPRLEYLMLGGSSIETVTTKADVVAGPDYPTAYVPPGVMAAAAATSGAVPVATRELPAALQQLSELLQLPADLPWNILSSCCQPSGLDGACDCSCFCCSHLHSSSATRDRSTGLLLVQNQPSTASIAAARRQALALAYAVALMPCLKAIEVTFMVPGVAGWLRQSMQQLQDFRNRAESRNKTEFNNSNSSHAGLSRSNSTCSNDSYACDSAGSYNQPLCSDSQNCASISSCHRCAPQVWEFSCVNAVQQAVQGVKQQQHSIHTQGAAATATAGSLHPSCLSTAVRCAANCSTRGRSTPLHAAAYTGCRCHLEVLLQAGAMVDARDGGGASPLFVAAEAGKAAAVAVLLAAGADALVGNSAGETPLYIAALRGHLEVVELLVEHFSRAGVDWMNGRLYGDAWTPLMAAAVANRVEVALYLLRAATGQKKGFTAAARKVAGPPGSSSWVDSQYNSSWVQQKCRAGSRNINWGGAGGAVQKLLAAENRYGQTALHIAARKGCRELLQLLLLYGAGKVAGRVADAAGDTPFDIARRHGHQVVLHELLQHS